ncbi:ABC transporter permease [Phototrophicus methaneseepsis]|uniref:ABC transporter permease n=1 Tax=Phototrophicus methaneseepsis TaxID=2710758 RepID=A0A7S8EAI8_9CHLR|nr:ABC transporter permease [Phototrophicus methaneseepsis]QPC83366.1 ABC transporter permease [Phototrophicus methaneseepsis]
MTQYITRRLIQFIPSMILIAFVGFLIMELPPGDYVTDYIRSQSLGGNRDAAAQEAAMREQFGLDKPFLLRFVDWTVGMVQGDFGISLATGEQVSTIISSKLGATVAVSLCTFILSWGLGIVLGVYSATHQYSKADNFLTTISFVGLGLPDFLIALVFLVFAWRLNGEVLTGLQSPQYVGQSLSLELVVDVLKHIWLPVSAVVITGMAFVMRVMRGNLLDELGKNYVTALRAKGVPERTVVWKHAFRNALHPLIGALSQTLAYLINGFVITSVVLDLPTIQVTYLTATQSQDIYLAGAILTLIGFLVLVGTLVSDILLAWLDPRIRFS